MTKKSLDLGINYLLRQGIDNFNGIKMFKVFTIGINKDVGINQICGQDIHRRAFLCQMPLLLRDRDERLVSLKAVSFLPFAIACFSFSDIRQILRRGMDFPLAIVK